MLHSQKEENLCHKMNLLKIFEFHSCSSNLSNLILLIPLIESFELMRLCCLEYLEFLKNHLYFPISQLTFSKNLCLDFDQLLFLEKETLVEEILQYLDFLELKSLYKLIKRFLDQYFQYHNRFQLVS